MPSENRFYQIKEPLRFFAAVGHSASQTYIGSAQVIDTVYAETVLQHGDQIHQAAGGTYMLRSSGEVREGRLTLPHHVFEAKYHPDTTEADLEAMAECGRLVRIARPATMPGYAGVRRTLDANDLPPLHRNPSIRIDSPGAAILKDIVRQTALRTDPIIRDVVLHDVYTHIHAELRIRFVDKDGMLSFLLDPRSRSADVVDTTGHTLASDVPDVVFHDETRSSIPESRLREAVERTVAAMRLAIEPTVSMQAC